MLVGTTAIESEGCGFSCGAWPLPAQDGLRLQHWRRAADEGKEYPFAQFSKSVEMPPFSDEEYAVSWPSSAERGPVSCDQHVTSMFLECRSI